MLKFDKNINILSLTKNIAKFELKLKTKKLVYCDLKEIFNTKYTEIQDRIADCLGKFINNLTIDLNYRLKIFEWILKLVDFEKIGIFSKVSLQDFYGNLIEHLVVNLRHYKKLFFQSPFKLIAFIDKNKQLTINIKNISNIIASIRSLAHFIDLINNTKLFKAIIFNIYNQLDKRKNIDNSSFNLFVSSLYTFALLAIPKMIWFDKEEKKAITIHNPCPEYTIIANNQGYHRIFKGVQGNRLWLEKTRTPIGYNIHLPKNILKISAVYVEVYGGDEAKDRTQEVERPGALSQINRLLLEKNIVVITLNLPDLLKLKCHQFLMGVGLHEEIHACIHKFYLTLRFLPHTLHPKLANVGLQNSRIILGGSSFGGRTAVRHAQLYPKTFDGYVSRSGWISAKADQKYSLYEEEYTYSRWLDPDVPSQIERINESILILPHRDDHNVSIKTSLSFCKAATKKGKSNLIRLCVTNGNAIPRKAYNKGHFRPSIEDCELYHSTLIHFIKSGHSHLTTVSEWRRFTESKFSDKFYIHATIIERFIAEALIIFKQNPKLNYLCSMDGKVWDSQYKHLFYAVLSAKKFSLSNAAFASEINRLKKGNLLTDNVIAKVLHANANIFFQYLNEYFSIESSIVSDFVANKHAIDNFKNLLFAHQTFYNERLICFLLFTLYKENPQLLVPLYASFDKSSQVTKLLHEAKVTLLKAQQKHKELIRNVWKQAAYKFLHFKKQASSAEEADKPQNNLCSTAKGKLRL